MRTSLSIIALAALVAATVFAASAFNYADLTPRAVTATVVEDDDAYLAIAASDPDYACMVDMTNGRIDVHWNSEASDCNAQATGDGFNKDAIYYYHDVLIITNKGTKTIANLYLNMSEATPITIQANAVDDAMDTDDVDYSDRVVLTNLAPGASYYIGFRIDTTGVNAGNDIARPLSIEARSTW